MKRKNSKKEIHPADPMVMFCFGIFIMSFFTFIWGAVEMAFVGFAIADMAMIFILITVIHFKNKHQR